MAKRAYFNLREAEKRTQAAKEKAIEAALVFEWVKLYKEYTEIPNPTLEQKTEAQRLLEKFAKARPEYVTVNRDGITEPRKP